jgi:hypothetical protein
MRRLRSQEFAVRASKWVVLFASLLPIAAHAEDQQLSSGSGAMSQGMAVGLMGAWTLTAGGILAAIALTQGNNNTKGPPNTTGGRTAAKH